MSCYIHSKIQYFARCRFVRVINYIYIRSKMFTAHCCWFYNGTQKNTSSTDEGGGGHEFPASMQRNVIMMGKSLWWWQPLKSHTQHRLMSKHVWTRISNGYHRAREIFMVINKLKVKIFRSIWNNYSFCFRYVIVGLKYFNNIITLEIYIIPY